MARIKSFHVSRMSTCGSQNQQSKAKSSQFSRLDFDAAKSLIVILRQEFPGIR